MHIKDFLFIDYYDREKNYNSFCLIKDEINLLYYIVSFIQIWNVLVLLRFRQVLRQFYVTNLFQLQASSTKLIITVTEEQTVLSTVDGK